MKSKLPCKTKVAKRRVEEQFLCMLVPVFVLLDLRNLISANKGQLVKLKEVVNAFLVN